MTFTEDLKNRIIQCRRMAAMLRDPSRALTLEQIAREYQKDYRAVTGRWPQLPAPWDRPTIG